MTRRNGNIRTLLQVLLALQLEWSSLVTFGRMSMSGKLLMRLNYVCHSWCGQADCGQYLHKLFSRTTLASEEQHQWRSDRRSQKTYSQTVPASNAIENSEWRSQHCKWKMCHCDLNSWNSLLGLRLRIMETSCLKLEYPLSAQTCGKSPKSKIVDSNAINKTGHSGRVVKAIDLNGPPRGSRHLLRSRS